MMQTNKIDGIVKSNGYTFWCNVNITFDYIFQFLKDRFSDCLIISEFNNIDIFIFGERLPVEVQSTIYHYTEKIPRMSSFEQSVEKQIRENINTYGRCWFFFDSEFYRYLENHTKKDSSIQLDWLYEYIKLDKLKVFIIDYKGKIEELFREDFDFIRDISVTCKIGKDDDFRILTINKDLIFENVLDGNGFTTDYIYKIRSIWKSVHKKEKGSNFKLWCTKQNDDRIKLLGYMMLNINNLNFINDVFAGKIIMNKGQASATIVGIFDIKGVQNATIKFVDRFDICQYFPAYLRNKVIWDRLRGCSLNSRQFYNVTTGKSDVIHGIDHFWREKSNDDDKDINIEIKNKDQIVTVNIKKTGQVTIDDAWI